MPAQVLLLDLLPVEYVAIIIKNEPFFISIVVVLLLVRGDVLLGRARGDSSCTEDTTRRSLEFNRYTSIENLLGVEDLKEDPRLPSKANASFYFRSLPAFPPIRHFHHLIPIRDFNDPS